MNETVKKLSSLGFVSAYIANHLNIRYQDYIAIKKGNATQTNFNIAEKTRDLISNSSTYLKNQNKQVLSARASIYSGTLYDYVKKLPKEIIKSYSGWSEPTIDLYLSLLMQGRGVSNFDKFAENEILVFYNIFNHKGTFNYVVRENTKKEEQVPEVPKNENKEVKKKKIKTRYISIKYNDLTVDEQAWFQKFDFKYYLKNEYTNGKTVVEKLDNIMSELGFSGSYSPRWYTLATKDKTLDNYILVRALYAYTHNLPKVNVKYYESSGTTVEDIKEVPVEDNYEEKINKKKELIKSLKYQIAKEEEKSLDKEIEELLNKLNSLKQKNN